MSDIVPVTVLVLVGSTELKQILTKTGPTMTPVIAGFIVGVGLYAIDGVNSELAKVFSILIIIGALIANGEPIFSKLGGKLK